MKDYLRAVGTLTLLGLFLFFGGIGQATTNTNDAAYWGETCFKIDEGPGGSSWVADANYLKVVLKAGTENFIFDNVVQGQEVATSGQDISHMILCPYPETTTTLATTTTTLDPTTTTTVGETTTTLRETTTTVGRTTTTLRETTTTPPRTVTIPTTTTTTVVVSSTQADTTTTIPISELPFTGFRLGSVLAIGLALTALGMLVVVSVKDRHGHDA